MAKKDKGLGKDVQKSLDAMDSLLDSLDKFSGTPLKKGLASNGVSDKEITKLINTAREQSVSLKNAVEDIIRAVKEVKTNTNSRFASQRVVENFLKSTF